MAVDFQSDGYTSIKYELLSDLLKNGKDYFKDSESISIIPEISSQLNPLVMKIIQGINERLPTNNTTMILTWCCLSGIGATMHWHNNREQLKVNGIYETLTKERGLSEMDEYVLDFIGLPFYSDDAKNLIHHIQKSSRYVIILMIKHSTEVNPRVEKDVYYHACEAMYFYGMAIQMNRLGMQD